MNGRAVPFDAGFERAAVGVQPLELRQQRRVDVEHSPVPARHEPRCQQPHETGEADDLDAVALQFGIERAFERFAVRSERTVIDDGGRDAGSARAGESRGVADCLKQPARSPPDSRPPSPPRSAPSCSSRVRKSAPRRACGSCASPRKVETPAKLHAGCRRRRRSPRRAARRFRPGAELFDRRCGGVRDRARQSCRCRS